MQASGGLWTLLFGWACVVPAALPQSAPPPSGAAPTVVDDGILAELEREWQRTVSALDQLRGLEQGLAAGAKPEPGYMREHSEPARWSLEEAGVQLVQLSQSMRALEQELQALRTRPPERPSATAPAVGTGAATQPQPNTSQTQSPEPAGSSQATANQTSGLSTDLRDRHAQATRSRALGRVGSLETPLQLPAQASLFSARAAYLAGDFASALAQFERLPDSPEVQHWRARSLERLGRIATALERYDALSKDPAAGSYAARAEQDARFLRWKQALDTASPSPSEAP
jgi:hypothetical protein